VGVEVKRGDRLRGMGLKGRTWQGEDSGRCTWEVKGIGELTDGREAAQEPWWVDCDIRRTMQNFAQELYQDEHFRMSCVFSIPLN